MNMSTTSIYEYVRHILAIIFRIMFALSVSLLKYETFRILERFMNTFPYSCCYSHRKQNSASAYRNTLT